jgi:hypothetical protein
MLFIMSLLLLGFLSKVASQPVAILGGKKASVSAGEEVKYAAHRIQKGSVCCFSMSASPDKEAA